MSDEPADIRQERRAKRLRKKRTHMPQHSRNLAKIYMDAIVKRLKRR